MNHHMIHHNCNSPLNLLHIRLLDMQVTNVLSVSAWIQYFVPSIQASHISRTRDVVIQYILQYSKQKDCKPGTRGNYSTYYNKHLSIRFHLGTLEPDSSSYAYTLCEPHCDSKLDIEKVRVHLNSFESIIN